MDPHHFDADPNSDFYLVRIWWFVSGSDFSPWCESGSRSRLPIKAQTLEKVLNRLIFHTIWLVVCKLMRIQIRFWIQLITLMRIWIRIFIWYGCRFRCGSRLPKWRKSMQIRMRIWIHNTALHGVKFRAVLWIRIGINADLDLLFWWPTIVKFKARKILFLISNISIYLSLGLHEGHTNYNRSLQPSKENI